LYQRNRAAVLAASGYRCAICHGPANTADHIVPLALGGTHDIENLRALCRKCNSKLGAGVTNHIKAQRQLGRSSRRW
jgi:5-methylcytosine-specific restriction endonuclease McrA